jgi:hypothetical protein
VHQINPAAIAAAPAAASAIGHRKEINTKSAADTIQAGSRLFDEGLTWQSMYLLDMASAHFPVFNNTGARMT